MRRLSLWQPWATLIALGIKGIETRSWGTSFRGLIAIHAARRWTRDEEGFTRDFVERWGLGQEIVLCDRHPIRMTAEYLDPILRPPLGRVVAVTRLAGCQVMDR